MPVMLYSGQLEISAQKTDINMMLSFAPQKRLLLKVQIQGARDVAQQLTKPQVRVPAANGGSQQHITPGDGRATMSPAPEYPVPLLTSEGTKYTRDKQTHVQAKHSNT